MMLDQLRHPEAGTDLMRAVEWALADTSTLRTPDLGGHALTTDFGMAITAAIG